ncbi:sensor histidine kinase [Azovibrio restrictus]|uniref:sensor histidine kinase n=1 Tax=Azovibrio restrictus TaxID=146938 RepID=UPI0026F10298|nr:sensor histidine kinase [Azovibrio restrictus]MDD3483493.1 sensor histidine kinase [Azovibrio restrictus]
MNPWAVFLLAAGYLGLLFAIARFGDRRADQGRSIISANVYGLSLAVYCTSWTFFGSVGRAASGGMGFLTIYLGPTLMLMLAPVLLKMIRISKRERLTSIADFIAARYGKRQALAGLVTVIAVIGIVPYIALQLKAIAASLQALFPERGGLSLLGLDATAVIALALASFTILFGTRHLDATERHEGMVAAIAFESIVKLVAFLAVGLFVTYGMYGGFADLFRQAEALPRTAALLDLAQGLGNWGPLVLLSALAIVLLPRQFQILVVENVDESHLRRAVWLFPLYLLLINIFVLPIAIAGLLQGLPGNGDIFVLGLPLSQGREGLALLAFIGGLSAATGMVIVETIALSTMVCNDLVMPALLRVRALDLERRPNLSRLLLNIRRGAIVAILLLGYAYFRAAGEAYALVGIGLISFSAVAQFAPALFGGMYWRQGNRGGALAGLSAGFLVWAYTLLLPSFAKSGWIPGDFVEQGLFGLSWLRAHALFGLTGLDEISHCLFWSLFLNTACYLLFSLFLRPDVVEARQANAFVDVFLRRGGEPSALLWRGKASYQALASLLERFLGAERARLQLQSYARKRGIANLSAREVDAELVRFAEIQLAGALGSASARVVLASVVEEEELGLEEVLHILDEASQVRAYSRELERKSRELEAATGELRAANARLQELDRLKDDFVSTVTHELRTPLTSIRAFSELLAEDPDMAVPERQRFLGIIVTETERLTRLINQILDLAKLEAGRADWTSSEVDLAGLVREAATSLEQLFRDRGVALALECPGEPVPVLADGDRLTQVMINLLSNAVKFAPLREGRVSVQLRPGLDKVQVRVTDNGPGIGPEEKEFIFERFRQGGNTLTDKPKGTGLGLPISLQIVEYFGGRLWVESEPGQGASFIFELPLLASN